MTLHDQLNRIHAYEHDALLDDDAIIHKATQEHGECIEAYVSGNLEQTLDESADVLSNVLSATQRVCGDLPLNYPLGKADPIVSTILFSQWNDTLQAFRKIYTRHAKYATHHDVMDATQAYVSSILGLNHNLGSEVDITGLMDHTLSKRKGRSSLYLPQINLEDYVIDVPDFPKEGILFKDISPLLESPQALDHTANILASYSRDADVIVGLDARGFIFGSLVAQKLGKKFVIARKPGKLPRETVDVQYDLEYGSNGLSLHRDAIQPGEKVVVIDDLLATGGTAQAANTLISQLGGDVIGNYFVIELDELGGKDKLATEVRSILHY